jgi:hypothetical protein
MPADDLARVVTGAAHTLQRRVQTSVALVDPVVIAERGRNVVVRCRVLSARSSVASVIVKRFEPGGPLGLTDWASLAFLALHPETAALVPRLYGGDSAYPFCVLEDLGEAASLEDMLVAGEPGAVWDACARLARQYARLHAATLAPTSAAAEARYLGMGRALRADLPSRHQETRRWLQRLERVQAWFRAANRELPPGFVDACAQVASAYADPKAWLAFTYGDPAPTNNHISATQPERVKLLDFEYGGFRHALYDLTAWYVLCPLPHAVVQEMRRAYVDELAARHSAFPDLAESYEHEWASIVAYRALAMMSWFPPSAWHDDRRWIDDWTVRAALLTTLRRLAEATEGIAALESIALAAAQLHAALSDAWPEARAALPDWSRRPSLGPA